MTMVDETNDKSTNTDEEISQPDQNMGEGKDIGQNKTEDKSNFPEILKMLLGAIGVFAALCYFLGRLYVEHYYYALGITPNVLSLGTNDYMFSSFNLIIMSLMISIWLYMYWLHSKSGKTMDNKNYWILFALFILAAASLFYSPRYTVSYLTIGFSAVISGFFYGLLLYMLAMYLQSSVKKQPKDTGKQPKNSITSRIVIVILVVLFFFILLPMVTDSLASTQAKCDMTKFPIVTVICKDELPAQLQASSSNVPNIVEGQLMITNNGMTYVLQSDNVTVYAIPVDSIKDIIYMKK